MKLRLAELPVKGQRVLLRVDFNVPLSPDGIIEDDSRIRFALPTIRYILDHGGTPILMSHLGRPDGRPDPRFSLAPCAKRLEQHLNQPVIFSPDCVGPAAEKSIRPQKPILLENLRFHIGEEHPDQDPSFVEKLASLGNCYVNDAFGTCHRAHASIVPITKFFPSKAAMGLLIERELSFLSPLIHNPTHPFHVIIGGAKIESKIGALQKLLQKLDELYIGGKMAHPFLATKENPGECDIKEITASHEIIEEARKRGVKLHLPIDCVATRGDEISSFTGPPPLGWKGVDVGQKTILDWSRSLHKAATIFWNGPLGVYEKPPFDLGTKRLAQELAKIKATIVIGGGDSVAAIEQSGLSSHFSHLSTGGGATLEFLEYGHLPGIDALTEL